MTGKEILLQAIQNKETPRAAWTPFVGVHGSKLINEKASDYLQSSDLIFKGLQKATDLYKPDGIPVVFDLQMEAEILGCKLRWDDDLPPSVLSHPLATGYLKDLPEYTTDKGRFPIVKEAMAKYKKVAQDAVAIYGLITGPFTLAIHLCGNNLFMDMIMDPEKVKTTLDFCVGVCLKTSAFYLENGADVIALVDPMTSQISPEHFEQYVTPFVNEIFDYIRDKKGYSSIFVCGDATRNLENMFQTHCDYLSIDENISLEFIKGLAQKHDKAFGGNLKLTSVLLFGNETESKLHTIETLDMGGTKGFILAPGCDLPYACPEENLAGVAEMVLDEYQREIARTTLKSTHLTFDDAELPDYTNPDKLIIEVVTLDSGSCAPCQYMVGAAKKTAEHFGSQVEVLEHKISTRNGLGLMNKLGVKNIPTLCIDGEITFVSIIPDPNQLETLLSNKLDTKHG